MHRGLTILVIVRKREEVQGGKTYSRVVDPNCSSGDGDFWPTRQTDSLFPLLSCHTFLICHSQDPPANVMAVEAAV